MDALILQFLNGLDKGGAYALIALGLTLTFGTLGVVNFAHGALFMLGAFCAVGVQELLTLSKRVRDESITFFEAYKDEPYLIAWFGDTGALIIDWAVPLSIFVTIPAMLLVGLAFERGLIRHFYNRPHAEQILVTFGLAIVLSELVKLGFGANPIPVAAPEAVSGSANVGVLFGADSVMTYPWWRIIYLIASLIIIGAVFAFLNLTTYGMVVRAGMADRETVQFLGINIERRFTVVFGIAAV
ncbi:MAG: branched-chain amino acid ABC transporter permease, partial [Pseudomonadota bacterium]